MAIFPRLSVCRLSACSTPVVLLPASSLLKILYHLNLTEKLLTVIAYSLGANGFIRIYFYNISLSTIYTYHVKQL